MSDRPADEPNDDRDDYLDDLRRRSDRAHSTGDHSTAVDLATEAIDFLGGCDDIEPTVAFTWRAFRAKALNDNREFARAELELLALLVERSELEGLTSPAVMRVRGHLARTLALSGRVDDGLRMPELLLSDRRRVLGDDHRETLDSYGHLAHFHHLAGNDDESVRRYSDLLERRRRLLGEHHPETEQTRANLATVTARRGDANGIDSLRERVEHSRRTNGVDAESTLTAEALLAEALIDADQPDEAFRLVRHVQLGRERMGGPRSVPALVARHIAARALLHLDQHSDGLMELVALARAMPIDPDHPHPLALDIACDLIAYTGVALVDRAQPPIVVLSRVVDAWHSLELAQRRIPERHPAHEVLEDYQDLINAIRG